MNKIIRDVIILGSIIFGSCAIALRHESSYEKVEEQLEELSRVLNSTKGMVKLIAEKHAIANAEHFTVLPGISLQLINGYPAPNRAGIVQVADLKKDCYEIREQQNAIIFVPKNSNPNNCFVRYEYNGEGEPLVELNTKNCTLINR